jgi:hypothetical protein
MIQRGPPGRVGGVGAGFPGFPLRCAQGPPVAIFLPPFQGEFVRCSRLGRGFRAFLFFGPTPSADGFFDVRAFLLMMYSMGGETPRTCYGATLFG